MQSGQHSEFGDYFAFVRRRKMELVVPLVTILFITVLLAFGLPAIYQSTATILVEQQEIPQELVRSTVNSYAEERIQLISKRVMTRENLMRIAKKYDLYPDVSQQVDQSNVIQLMRENIGIEMVSADVRDPKSGRENKATIAFDLSFDSRDPMSAKKVAEELSSLFLKENIKIRTQRAEVTADFLADEANRLNRQISALEDKLAAFKERNVGRLPELMQMNMNLMDRTGRELEETERNLTSLEEKRMKLEVQLAQLDPNTGDSPEGRLRVLQAKYLQFSSIYAPNHPDLVRMRREIDILKRQTGLEEESGADIAQQILEVRQQLAAAMEKYSEQHPDVVKLTKTLERLIDESKEKQIISSETITQIEFKPDNPAYIAIQTQLDGLKIKLKAERGKRARLKQKLELYETRLTEMPRVEQEGLTLRRDYDNAVKKYHEIKQKQLQAQVGEQLEKESKGERFSLLDPPIVPSSPIKPNRLGILLLGTFFSFSGSIGFAGIAEFFDRTVRGAQSVSRILQAPPLVMIPYIRNRRDQKRLWARRFIALFILTASLLLIAGLMHAFVTPLDMLFK